MDKIKHTKTTLRQTLKLSIMPNKNIPFDLDRVKLYHYNNNLKKRWEITYYVYDANKDKLVRRRDASFNSKNQSVRERTAAANSRIDEIKNLLKKGFHIGKSSDYRKIGNSFDEIFELKSVEYSKRTKESVLNVLNDFKFFMKDKLNKPLKSISKHDLIEYRDYIIKNRKIAAKTANGYHGYLAMMLTAMVERDWIEYNPFKQVKKLKELKSRQNRGFTKQEVEILKPALKQDFALWLYVQFIYYCWLRPIEICHLRVSALNLDDGVIRLNAQETKGKKDDFVKIPNGFLEILKKLDLNNYLPSMFIFAKDSKTQMFGFEKYDDNRFTKKHKYLCKKLKLEIQMYGWKREGVKMAALSGATIYEIKRHGRWATLREVDTYLESSGIDLYSSDSILNMPSF